jgi:hypothetical protein
MHDDTDGYCRRGPGTRYKWLTKSSRCRDDARATIAGMSTTDTSHVERNAVATDRLRGLVARLDEKGLEKTVGEGWTVSSALAHVAFWDRMVEARWARGPQGVLGVPEAIVDLVNDALMVEWRMLEPASAAALAVNAAEDADRAIAAAPADLVFTVEQAGLTAMLDRSGHRHAHLNDIERALGH